MLKRLLSSRKEKTIEDDYGMGLGNPRVKNK